MRQTTRKHVAVKHLAQIVAGENQRAAGVFFLGEAEKIGGEAQLRLHLFFAIAEIVVGDDGDDDAGFVAAGQLESIAAVVKFVFLYPAHAVTALAFGGLVEGRQADGFFGHLRQVRRENHAAGVAGPMFAVERGVIFRQQRITPVFKNGFNKIQITYEAARHKETDFHGLLFGETWDFRADERPDQQ